MATDNLALWHSVEKTDPAHTKAITGKPYKGTSPKPYWIIRRATEVFGPMGLGWGMKILSERVEDGSLGDKVHIAHVQVWYIWNDKRGEVEHIGQTMFAGKNKNGPFTDDDAPKKSVTDALIKALSMIGFAGDIFMGRFDDSKYVAEVKREFEDAEKDTGPTMSELCMIADKALANAAQKGVESLKTEWIRLDPDIQDVLMAKKKELYKLALEIDARKTA